MQTVHFCPAISDLPAAVSGFGALHPATSAPTLRTKARQALWWRPGRLILEGTSAESMSSPFIAAAAGKDLVRGRILLMSPIGGLFNFGKQKVSRAFTSPRLAGRDRNPCELRADSG